MVIYHFILTPPPSDESAHSFQCFGFKWILQAAVFIWLLWFSFVVFLVQGSSSLVFWPGSRLFEDQGVSPLASMAIVVQLVSVTCVLWPFLFKWFVLHINVICPFCNMPYQCTGCCILPCLYTVAHKCILPFRPVSSI